MKEGLIMANKMLFKCKVCGDINEEEVPELLYAEVMYYQDHGNARNMQALTELRCTACMSERNYTVREILSFIAKHQNNLSSS